MANFGKSLSRELGKNTGKWVSNKVFGDNWSTPHRIIVQNRQREERQQQRVEANEYKQQLLLEKKVERDIENQQKQQEREFEQLEKENRIKENLNDIEKHNNYIQTIQSVHLDYSNPVDWSSLSNTEPPEKIEETSQMSDYYSNIANEESDNKIREIKENLKLSMANRVIGKTYNRKNAFLYKIPKYKIFKVLPIVFLFLTLLAYTKNNTFGLIVGLLLVAIYYLLKFGSDDFVKMESSKEEIERIENNRINLKENLLSEHDEYYNQYLADKKDYADLMNISNGVQNNDSNSFIYAINFFKPFEDLKNYGSDISFTFDKTLNINFFAKDKQVIPNFTKKALRNGLELSDEPMSNSRYNEIYQDYVCSCVLRIGKEIFALLPIEEVNINVKSNLLDRSTGNYRDSTILSVILNKNIIDKLNFDLLDPSDSMRNFTHHMNFDKNIGFYEVNEVV